jgi:DnaJ-class molecular chaperone
MSTINYDVVLGIAEDGNSDTIRGACRMMARRYHPTQAPAPRRLNSDERGSLRDTE